MGKRTKSQIGKASRDKGKRFERQSREIMAEVSGWPHWKRTQRGDTQHMGDLVECVIDGSPKPQHGFSTTWYVECKVRGAMSLGMLMAWYQDTEVKARKIMADKWVLIAKQDRGVIMVIRSDENRIGDALSARLY